MFSIRTLLRSLACMLAISHIQGWSATYYVDSRGGDDTRAGTHPRTAWRSLTRVNHASFQAGDEVLFHRGSQWSEDLVISCQGSAQKPILFGATGKGPRPLIQARGSHENAVTLSNAANVVFRDFEITNYRADTTGTNRLTLRGVQILGNNAGVLSNIVVSNLFIHDVRGTQRKKENGGVIFTTRGDKVPTRFHNLIIAGNIVWRVDRSGIVAQSSHASRSRWFPSTGVVIRDNWIGDVGGDGITPWATDGCLVEHNIVQGANERAGTYNAGIWPWSTDNTIIRLNRASQVKTLLHGQGFDSDYNSRNTVIEYNLSHDNEGGFLLVCTPGKRNTGDNLGNVGTVARYNISRNDRARTFHIAGAPEQTTLERNAIYIGKAHEVQLLLLSDWSGWANGVHIRENLFHSEGLATYGHQVSRDYTNGSYGIASGWGPATGVRFQANRYFGSHDERPQDEAPVAAQTPKPIEFKDWPGPQFDPREPDSFPRYIKTHRKWMLSLMKRQFPESHLEGSLSIPKL